MEHKHIHLSAFYKNNSNQHAKHVFSTDSNPTTKRMPVTSDPEHDRRGLWTMRINSNEKALKHHPLQNLNLSGTFVAAVAAAVVAGAFYCSGRNGRMCFKELKYTSS